MKLKSIAFLAGALAASAAIADTEVIIGFTQVNSPNKNTIVGIPYTNLEGGNVTVADFVKTSGLLAGDKCYAMSTTAGLYDAWELVADGSGVLSWSPVSQVQMLANGTVTVTTSPTAAETTLAPGSALWIVREGDNRAYATPFYVMGKMATTTDYPSSTIAAATTDGEKTVGTWSLVANCGPAAKSIEWLMGKFGDNVATGDKIVMPADSNNGLGQTWNYRGSSLGWSGKSDSKSNTMIQPGMGVWVYNLKTEAITVDWVEAEASK